MDLEIDKYAKITIKGRKILIDREYLTEFFISVFKSNLNQDLLIEQFKEEV